VKTTILIADDHSVVRMGIRTLIGFQKDMTVVGEACNGEEAVQLVRKLRPDVVTMDLMMPKLNGADATKAIINEFPATKIIILTSFGTSADLARAEAAGAVGAQIKEGPTDDLLAAIRTVAAGGTAFAPELGSVLAKDQAVDLTELQLQILESVVRGLSNNQIACQHDLSLISAKRQLADIFAKLGAANRTEAVAIALRKCLLKS